MELLPANLFRRDVAISAGARRSLFWPDDAEEEAAAPVTPALAAPAGAVGEASPSTQGPSRSATGGD